MSDQAKIERLLKLMTLLTGPFYYTVKELSEKIEITERTVYRYLDSLQNAGFVIHQVKGRHQLVNQNREGAMLYDLLHFTQEEAFVMSKAIHSIDGNNIIKSNIVKKLYSLYDFDKAAEAVVNPQYSENVHRLLQSIKEKKQVVLHDYQSAHGNIISDRIVEAFEFTTDFISIWCYEPNSGKNKLFKTARIKEVEITSNQWQYEISHQKGFIDMFRISSFNKIQVKLELSIREANLLIEEYPLARAFISKTSENKYVLDGWVCDFAGISRFCLGLIDEIIINEPQELKIQIKERIGKNKL